MDKLESVEILDLFAGGGGFSLGFEMAGFRPGVLLDFWPKAVETLVANYSHKGGIALQADLSTLSPRLLQQQLVGKGHAGRFDIIIGGPPCQGWSMIGRGKLRSLGFEMRDLFDDPRNKMYKHFIKYVEFFKPKVFVMENVTGMLQYNGQNVAEKISKYFSKKGYILTWGKINAKDFGIPQNRERLFFVGVRKDLGIEFQIPLKGHFESVTLRDAISDLPVISDGSKVWLRKYNPRSKEISAYAALMRKGADPKMITDHICKKHRVQDVNAFKYLKQGQQYKDLPAKFKRYRDDIFGDKYRKLKYHNVSGCITAHLGKDQYSHLHPTQARAITVREAARIQSFPDSYIFAGGASHKFKLIGNAVPPLLANVFANALKVQVFKTLR